MKPAARAKTRKLCSNPVVTSPSANSAGARTAPGPGRGAIKFIPSQAEAFEKEVLAFEEQLLSEISLVSISARLRFVIRQLAEASVQANQHWTAICSLGQSTYDPAYRYIFELYGKFSRQVLHCVAILKSLLPKGEEGKPGPGLAAMFENRQHSSVRLLKQTPDKTPGVAEDLHENPAVLETPASESSPGKHANQPKKADPIGELLRGKGPPVEILIRKKTAGGDTTGRKKKVLRVAIPARHIMQSRIENERKKTEAIRNRRKYEKRKAELVIRRAALVAQLGGKCANAKCGSRLELQFDHPNGRAWRPDRCGWTRLKIYEREARAGIIRLLCAKCNRADGARRKNSGYRRND